MYPDWPASASDLVPLPRCDGPKLKPFDFQGPQQIEFLQELGEGMHSFVFKARILGQIYAVKLFRFVYDEDWLNATEMEQDDLEARSAFYDYSEPFSCECRAFGRLQEAGHEELAVKCFGYVLIDEEHERALTSQFSHLPLGLNGNAECFGFENLRARFLGKDGRPPPIRGIVKEFGRADEDLRTSSARRILRDVIQLQQLGIISIDVAHRQIISGKLSDFSTAITTPHYMTTPELNPRLTPEWISAMELETFRFSINDYWTFDHTVREWNEECRESRNLKGKLSVYAFPGGEGCRIKYGLRSTASRERVYSFVDPRLYETRVVPKTRWRLDARPPRWYYDCDSKRAEELKSKTSFDVSLTWSYRDGLIFPQTITSRTYSSFFRFQSFPEFQLLPAVVTRIG